MGGDAQEFELEELQYHDPPHTFDGSHPAWYNIGSYPWGKTRSPDPSVIFASKF